MLRGDMHAVCNVILDSGGSDIRPAHRDSKRGNAQIACANPWRWTSPALGGRGRQPGAC